MAYDATYAMTQALAAVQRGMTPPSSGHDATSIFNHVLNQANGQPPAPGVPLITAATATAPNGLYAASAIVPAKPPVNVPATALTVRHDWKGSK